MRRRQRLQSVLTEAQLTFVGYVVDKVLGIAEVWLVVRIVAGLVGVFCRVVARLLRSRTFLCHVRD